MARIRFEDDLGNLWIRFKSDEGINFSLFNIYTMQHLPVSEWLDGALKDVLFDAAKGAGSTVLLSTKNGALQVMSLPTKQIRTLYTSTLGPLWFCTPEDNRHGIWVSPELVKNEITSLILLTLEGVLKARYDHSSRLFKIISLGNGAIWYNDKLTCTTIRYNGHIQTYSLPEYMPYYKHKTISKWSDISMQADDGPLWYCDNGILYNSGMQQKNEGISIVSAGNLNPTDIYCMIVDKHQVVWLSTINGLYKIVFRTNRFQKIFWEDPKNISEKSIQNTCRGMSEDGSGNMYFSVRGDIVKVPKGSTSYLDIAKSTGGELYTHTIDPSGHLWFCCNEKLIRHHLGTHSVTAFSTPFRLSDGSAWSCFAEANRLWLGIGYNLSYINTGDKTISMFNQYNGYDLLKNADIYSIQSAGEKNKLWLVTSTGLYLLDKENGVQERYWKGGKGKFYLPAENFRHLQVDRYGIYWLASSEGLIRWNKAQSVCRQYTVADGLPNNNLYAVYADSAEYLWLSSDRGLIQFQPSSERLRYFLIKDGITCNEFNRISHFKASDGTLYFGGLNGITKLHPRDFWRDFEQDFNISILLTAAKQFPADKDAAIDILPEFRQLGKVTLNPGDRYLYFEFANPDYSSSGATSYEYRIEGLNNNWNPLNSPKLYVAGLPYGDYNLLIRTRSGNGSINQQFCQIKIDVPPPFYLTPWFFLVVGAFIFFAARWYVLYRERTLRVRQQELAKEVAVQTEKITYDKLLIEQQADRLAHLAEEKSRFFANIAHEQRTPLALILSTTKKILKSRGINKIEQELATIAVRNTNHLLKMVNDILYLSTSEVASQRLKLSPVDLDELVSSLLSDYKPLAQQKNIKLHRITARKRPETVRLDPYYFGIVVGNLLSNAIKFTGTGGNITVEVKSNGDKVVLVVTDTGRGIHPGDLPHIFERYFQTQVPGTTVEGGTGIGLALSKELTEMMDGAIRVESGLGKGSTFYVALPVFNEKEKEDQQHNSTVLMALVDPENMPKTLKILVVEDHADFQYMIKMILQEHFEVSGAFNGAEALTHLESYHLPDLIVCDLMMPDMDGWQLIAKIKAKEAYSCIPILVITALHSEQSRHRALRLGVDDYLLKPFDDDVFLTTIRVLLKRSRKRESVSAQFNIIGNSQATGNGADWLFTLEQTILKRMGDVDFTVDTLADLMLMGRRTFYREVSRLTGLTPSTYIKEARLQQARFILEQGWNEPIEQLVAKVGVRDVKYFSFLYKERFGKAIDTYSLPL
jgi:signal transduction histidine kinase/CheY-like chemotaxis protein/streptogramin lyase